MPLYDFECSCGNKFEAVEPCAEKDENGEALPVTSTCKCGNAASRVFTTCKVLETIVPIYPGSKKRKAGYIHSHGDKPATKTMGKGWSPPN